MNSNQLFTGLVVKGRRKKPHDWLPPHEPVINPQQDLFNLKRQKEIIEWNKKTKLINLTENLKSCGEWKKKKAYCRKCEELDIPSLVSVKKIQVFCKIRYCPNPDCFVDRFADLIEEMKSIKELQGYKTLWHGVIGFNKIPLSEFQNNFPKYRKRYAYVINSYFSKLRKKFVNLQGIKVLDLSFVEDSFVFPHFHLSIIPVSKIRRGIVMKKCQEVRKDMIKRQKVKMPFHIQFFKHSKKKTTLSYLAVRSVGLYKHKNTSNLSSKDFKLLKLKELIKTGLFLTLDKVLSQEQYVNDFFNRRSYSTFGGVSYGSIIRDNIVHICKVHGEISGRGEVRVEFEDIIPLYPPNTTNSENPPEIFEVVKFGNKKQDWKSLGKEHLQLLKEVEKNKKLQKDKQFSNYCDSKNVKLNLQDKLNLLAFNKT